MEFTSYALPPLASAVAGLVLAAIALRHRAVAGGVPFIALMIGLIEWSVGYALELLAVDPEVKFFWHRLMYFGVVAVPVCVLVFALAYAGKDAWLRPRTFVLLAIEPVVVVLLAWTNSAHGLMWPTHPVRAAQGVILLDVTFGPAYQFNVAYSYVLVVGAVAVLAQTLRRGGRLYGQQVFALLVAILAPLAANVYYNLGVGPFPGLDVTPFAFAATGIGFLVGLLRFRVLDLVPIAREAIFESMADATFAVDERGRIIDLNPAAVRLAGAPAKALIGEALASRFHDQDALSGALEAAEDLAIELQIGPADAARTYELHSTCLRRTSGAQAGKLVILRDVTDRARAQQALRTSEEYFRAVIEHAADMISIIDEHGTICYESPSVERLLGYATGDNLGKSIFSLLHADDDADARQVLLNLVANPGGQIRCEYRVRQKDGSLRTLEATVTNLLDQPSVRGIVVNARDVTERRIAQAEVEYQALHDTLTDLPNRALLADRLDQALCSARRTRRPLSLLLMDLDHFKEVNDTLGHQAGDALLTEVAERLQGRLRLSDTIARLGGDEFAIVLPDTDEAGACRVAGVLQGGFEDPFLLSKQYVSIGTSIGITTCEDGTCEADALLRRADVGMYHAKREQLGSAVYRPEHDHHSPEQLALVGELRSAIDGNQLVLHYQPKVDVSTGRTTHLEALLRWEHPRHGLLGPDRFIPLAERSGLIHALSGWVLDAALKQARTWYASGRSVPIAVNLSVQDLRDRSLPALVQNLLERHCLPARMLIVEITESGVMTDPVRASEVLERLRALGVRVAVDDFGAGHSALGYLKLLPIDEIKIDRSFVQAMVGSAKDRAIVSAAIGLAHQLGLSVVAEGVEDRPTWEALAALGCDLAQGFYFSRPVPSDALPALLPRASERSNTQFLQNAA